MARQRRNSGPTIAVLGAGIMGCSLALFLARRGAHVTLIDETPAPFARASRWNEGKIHLGYLYAGDASLETVRKVLPGGLAFRALVEELVDGSIADAMTNHDDLFLVHRESVVDASAMGRHFEAVSELVRSHPLASGYLVDASKARSSALSKPELERIPASPLIVAGFQVPERSVQTRWLADRFAAAVRAEPKIDFVGDARVLEVALADDRWRVTATQPVDEKFEVVINALSEGRMAVDRTAGVRPDAAGVSYRYRCSLFVQTRKSLAVPSAVIATGPFGDVKNYNGTEFYLSWYPAGLIANEEGVEAPTPLRRTDHSGAGIASRTFEALAGLLPGTAEIKSHALSTRVEGGWVVAYGRGLLSDPASSLHRRDRFGVARHGSYVTVDTGKFSTAPWLARTIADALMG